MNPTTSLAREFAGSPVAKPAFKVVGYSSNDHGHYEEAQAPDFHRLRRPLCATRVPPLPDASLRQLQALPLPCTAVSASPLAQDHAALRRLPPEPHTLPRPAFQ
jgi:hypothetical protein